MKAKRCVRAGLVLLFVLGLSACAAGGSSWLALPPPAPYPPPGYAHTVSTSAVTLYWNCYQPEAAAVRLEGLIFNLRGDQPVRLMEFALSGVDSRDGTVSEAEAEARDYQIFTQQSSPFLLELRTTGREVRYDLYYKYQFLERGGHIMLSGPMVAGAFPRYSGILNLVRDACSPSQHLVK